MSLPVTPCLGRALPNLPLEGVMKVRVSKAAAIGALLVAVYFPTVASAATRDGFFERDGRFNRIIRIVKHLFHVGPNEDIPTMPKP